MVRDTAQGRVATSTATTGMFATSQPPVAAGASVSVLVVNYKLYDQLAACLASLAADDDGRRAEVIVVDHESDESRLRAAASHHPHVITVARQDNRGFAAGINEAAGRASGDLLLLINPDAVVMPHAIRRMADQLAARADVAAVGPKVLWPDRSLQATGRRFPTALTGLFGRTTALTRLWPNNPVSRWQLPAIDLTAPAEVDWVTGTCVMIRAQAFRDVGGFDEGYFLYWEDADLCQRLRARGSRVMFLPDAVVVHAAAQSSEHARVRSLVAFHRSALRYYRKYQRGPSRIVTVPFAAVALAARLLVKTGAALWRR